MLMRRTSIILLTFTASFTADHPANAGCCDWLFGRKEPAYVVGYTPYAVGYAPQAVAAPVVTQRIAVPAAAPAAATNGAYQAQRPAYDNPSVYTGMPVIMAPGPTQTSYRLPVTTPLTPQAATTVSAYRPVVQAYQQPNVVPLASQLRGGPAATSNPIYGTGNVYPNNYQTARYQAAYPAATTSTIAAPPAACPPVVQAAPAPVVVAAPPKRCCGLSRFFGCCWGNTNYQTSYYRAPITYYRPVTSVDPVMGTPVTVQQPCTSTVQQLQRTPYNGLFTQSAPAMAPAPMAGPACGAGCGTTPAPNTYLGPSTTPPATGAPVYSGQTYGNVGQVGGIASPSDRSVMPIPSTDPSYQPQPSYQPNTQPSYQPLQGAPSNGGDLQGVPQPRLESARPKVEVQSEPATDDSYWGSRDQQEKTALNSLQPTGGASSATRSYSQLRPIEAPSDDNTAIVQRSIQPPAVEFRTSAPPAKQEVSAPPLLPRGTTDEFDLRSTDSASLRISVPVREATMTRSRSVSSAVRVRDTGGWQAND